MATAAATPTQRPCPFEPHSQLPLRLPLPCQALRRRLAGQVRQRLVSPLLPLGRCRQDPSVLHVLPEEPPGLVPLQPAQGAEAPAGNTKPASQPPVGGGCSRRMVNVLAQRMGSGHWARRALAPSPLVQQLHHRKRVDGFRAGASRLSA
ncbi:hypothetical protein CFC21_084763, partial [Triticum aestivum]